MKIYSRPRLKLPKLVFYNRRKNKKRSKVLFIVIIAVITLKIIIDAVNPIFDALCEEEAISLATIISNNKANEIMKKHTYDELYTIEKDKSGNITMVKANVVPINDIMSDVAIKIQEEIDEKGRENIEIPLRKFYRN